MTQEKDSFEEENKKYFDPKKYNTLIVGKDGIKNADDVNSAIEAIAEGKLTTEEREEILKQLKASNPKAQLLKAINVIPPNGSGISAKAKLVAVCWEIELDCTEDFLFFVNQACDGDYMVAMECLTVIENIENEIPKAQLKDAQQLLTKKINSNPENVPMLEEILVWVNERI